MQYKFHAYTSYWYRFDENSVSVKVQTHNSEASLEHRIWEIEKKTKQIFNNKVSWTSSQHQLNQILRTFWHKSPPQSFTFSNEFSLAMCVFLSFPACRKEVYFYKRGIGCVRHNKHSVEWYFMLHMKCVANRDHETFRHQFLHILVFIAVFWSTNLLYIYLLVSTHHCVASQYGSAVSWWDILIIIVSCLRIFSQAGHHNKSKIGQYEPLKNGRKMSRKKFEFFLKSSLIWYNFLVLAD